MSRNLLKRFRADVVFAGSNYVQIETVSPEVRQLLREVRELLARIEAQQ